MNSKNSKLLLSLESVSLEIPLLTGVPRTIKSSLINSITGGNFRINNGKNYIRAINNLNIVIPCDNFETQEVIKSAVNYSEPLFIRFGKKPMLKIHNENQLFKIGKGIKVKEGKDLVFIATGETVQRAYQAIEILEKDNFKCTLISMHTIKPFDEDLFLQSIKKTKGIITVEEHSESGGLGEKCASILAQKKIITNFKVIGFPDEYMVNGSQSDVLDYYNMSPKTLAEIAKNLIS